MSEAGGRSAARAWRLLCWSLPWLAAALPAGAGLAAERPAARPNVVLLMADDLEWGDTGYNGHPVLATPSLDAMSAAGLRFDRFYAASPVCSPTRGSVLTGRHPMRFGVFGANVGHLRGEEITLGEPLPAGRPYDGIDLLPAIDGWQRRRPRPIGFRFGSQASLVDDRFKLIDNQAGGSPADDAAPRPRYQLYDVVADPSESRDLAPDNPRTVERMAQAFSEWQASCVRSWHGEDYAAPVRPRPAAAASGRLSR
jgi:arylsulfatase A-like enzyme